MRFLTLLLIAATLVPAGGADSSRPVVLVEGPGAGTIVDVSIRSRAVVEVEPSRYTGHALASGRIAPSAPGCDGPAFHGTLKKKADPRPGGCGWGKVIELRGASPIVREIALAVDSESRAEAALGVKAAASTAKTALVEASRLLAVAGRYARLLRDTGRLDTVRYDRIARLLVTAQTGDANAGALAGAEEQRALLEKQKELTSAGRAKRDAIRTLPEGLLLADGYVTPRWLRSSP